MISAALTAPVRPFQPENDIPVPEEPQLDSFSCALSTRVPQPCARHEQLGKHHASVQEHRASALCGTCRELSWVQPLMFHHREPAHARHGLFTPRGVWVCTNTRSSAGRDEQRGASGLLSLGRPGGMPAHLPGLLFAPAALTHCAELRVRELPAASTAQPQAPSPRYLAANTPGFGAKPSARARTTGQSHASNTSGIICYFL